MQNIQKQNSRKEQLADLSSWVKSAHDVNFLLPHFPRQNSATNSVNLPQDVRSAATRPAHGFKRFLNTSKPLLTKGKIHIYVFCRD
jgi:hypothetical protein